jgi:biotin carboxyl carrier protein
MKYFVTLGEREVEVLIDGEQVTVEGRTVVVHRTTIAGTPLHQVMIDGRPLLLPLERLGPGRWSVTAWGERRDATVMDERARQIEGLVRQAEPASQGGVIKAPMPGLVLRIPVAVGDAVAAGQGVLVLEAMKMENEIKAQAPGVVAGIPVREGQAVEKGQVLLQMGPAPGA